MDESEALKKEIFELKQEIADLREDFQKHEHSGDDNTTQLSGNILINEEKFFGVGGSIMTSVNTNVGETAETNRLLLGVERDSDPTFSDTTKATQLTLENQPGTTGSSNGSFFYGYRAPIYAKASVTGDLSGISISSAASTLTDSSRVWATNELQNAYVSVISTAGALLQTKLIASNTASTITISGTWGSTASDVTYVVSMPVYNGAANYPWRRVYAGEDLRFGFGPSAGTDVCFIKHGLGTPESVVTAQVGSLFLRRDGGSNTTLYVKESGTGNTGWAAI